MDHLPSGFVEQLAAADAEDARRAAADRDPNLLGRAAIWYADTLGWPVFPLAPGAKTPLTPRGFHDASVNPMQVDVWWTDTPAANIGTPTGHLFDVIDIDGPEGYRSYFTLKDAGELPPVLARSMTGRGQHLLVAPDPARTNRANVLPGIDIRARGGYIVLPPSLHPSGRRYRWDETFGPLCLPTAASVGV